MKRFKFTVEFEVDDYFQRHSEAGTKRALVKTLTRELPAFKIISSDCIEQKPKRNA